MDFFARQDKARKHTKVLVVYFVLAVACIIVSVYLASVVLFFGVQSQQSPDTGSPELVLWDATIFLYAVCGTLGVVLAGSLYKTAALAQGGSAVAESLGGRLLDPSSTQLDERKLYNVIEEMAIAAGVPVPKIYVLDAEQGINAFAAGHTPGDAAIGVTRGCMTLLDRDELQGVIGHELSHVLNGDMRMNLRLMGIVFGILCLAVLGRILIYARGDRERNPLMLLGFALIVIGGIGVFFGRLIQAALSRQREFLADASSVQFTRNPAGLSTALQKIHGTGSKLVSVHAGEASHMFFGNGLARPFLGILATHPPIEQRIHAIDPSWDGTFLDADAEIEPGKRSGRPAQPPRSPVSLFPFAAPAGVTPTVGSHAVVPMAAVLASVGSPRAEHLRYAEDLRQSLSSRLQAAAHEPLDATALVFALLLSPDDAVRATQLAGLARRVAPGVHGKTSALWPEVTRLGVQSRLPLAHLAVPALRRLDADQRWQLLQAMNWLIESDGQYDPFELCLKRLVRRRLELQPAERRASAVHHATLEPAAEAPRIVLSALAHAGSSLSSEVESALAAGLAGLGSRSGALDLLPPGDAGMERLDQALDQLALASPAAKKQLLEACVQVAGADGSIQPREAELLRAIAESLECPIPPFVVPVDRLDGGLGTSRSEVSVPVSHQS